MTSWLRKNDPGDSAVALDMSPFTLYQKFHDCMLLRCFFLQILGLRHDVAIAGSFVIAALLRNQGTCTWRPNDVDIWVRTPIAMSGVIRYFNVMVALPLGIDVHAERCQRYRPSYESTVDSFDIVEAMVGTSPLSSGVLREEIWNWIWIGWNRVTERLSPGI